MSGPSRTAWPWLVAATVGTMAVVGSFGALVASPAPFLDAAVWSFTGLGPLTVGALLVARRPHNPVGRLLVLIGFVWSVGEAARIFLWLDTALGPLPATDLAAWIVAWSFAPAFVLILSLLAVFPSGRVETRWLKWPLRIGLVLLVYWAVSAMVMPVDLGEFYDFLEGRTNPWAIEALATVVDEHAEVVEALDVVFNLAMLGLLNGRPRGPGEALAPIVRPGAPPDAVVRSRRRGDGRHVGGVGDQGRVRGNRRCLGGRDGRSCPKRPGGGCPLPTLRPRPTR